MSTKADRRHRSERRILPVNADDSKRTQIVDTDVRVRKPAHEPGTEWSRAEVEALLVEHSRPVDAARAAGISRQRVRQLMERFGLTVAPTAPRDPAAWMAKGRTLAPVRVMLRRDQIAWLEEHRMLPASAVRAAVDLLMVRRADPAYVLRDGPRNGVSYALRPDQHAWLNSHGRGQRSALVQQAVDLLMSQGKATATQGGA